MSFIYLLNKYLSSTGQVLGIQYKHNRNDSFPNRIYNRERHKKEKLESKCTLHLRRAEVQSSDVV